MATVTRTPSASSTPSGYNSFTVTGAASVHAALSDGSDGTYIAGSTSSSTARLQRALVSFADLALPAGAVIEWVKPVVREAHSTFTYVTVAQVLARNSSGQHVTAFSSAAIGSNPTDNVLRSTDGPVHAKASDGTKWTDCDPTSFQALVVNGPNYNFPTTITTPGKLAKLDLVVSYRVVPVVSSITPAAGSLSDTQPVVTWETGETQQAYRVMVVPAGSTDSLGRTAGSANFDPSTCFAFWWDSGKVYSAVKSAVVGHHLINGMGWYVYVRSWAPSVNDTELPSLWTTSGLLSVVNLDIVSPSLAVVDDLTTYTLIATVTRVSPGGGQTAPTFYTLERYDPTAGEWIDIAGAQAFSGAGPWQYQDPLGVPGNSVTYRSQGVYVAPSGSQVASPWVEASATLVDRRQWWLRDRVEPSLNRQLKVRDHAESIPKPQEVAYGAGARAATVTHQGVRASVHKVTVWALDATTYADLRSLIDTGRTLVFVTAFGAAVQVQVGEATEVTLVKAAPLSSESTPIRAARTIGLTLIEVEQ